MLTADADSRTYGAVAKALAQLGDPRALQPLQRFRYLMASAAPGERLSVSAALASLGDAEAGHDLKQAMQGDTRSGRTDALWALAAYERDRVDRILLSRDHDALSPAIDPADEVAEHDLPAYAAATGLSEDEVRARYEALAARYPLTLSWLPRDHD